MTHRERIWVRGYGSLALGTSNKRDKEKDGRSGKQSRKEVGWK